MRSAIATAVCVLALLGTAACGSGEPAGSNPAGSAPADAGAGKGDVTAACTTIKEANRAMFDMPGTVLLIDANSTPEQAAEAADAMKKAFADNSAALTVAAGQTTDAELLAVIDTLVKARAAHIAALDAAGRDGAKVAEARTHDGARDAERAVLAFCNR